ncbi:MAG: excalibur calcium-binding domain-containing protein [Ilumatobacteraceae bacterium]
MALLHQESAADEWSMRTGDFEVRDGDRCRPCWLGAFAILAILAVGCATKTVQGAPDVPVRTTPPSTAAPVISAPATTSTVPVTVDTMPLTTAPAATTTAATVAPVVVDQSSTTSAPDEAGRPLALDVLDTIVVENEHPMGYDRALFGYPADLGGNGCDTRSEVLQRDSTTLAQVDPIGCTVVAGDWLSVYDGLAFSSPGELEIDHVVALKEAWDSGAWAWSPATRIAYANDLSDTRTLRAVSVATNRSKGDKDPSNWLPPDQTDVCNFISDWVSIKARWGLSMDSSESGRIGNLLRGQCQGWSLASWTPPNVSTAPAPQAAPAPPLASVPVVVYYANCTAVRAAGAAPLHAGEPGYRLGLDRDKDGIACE